MLIVGQAIVVVLITAGVARAQAAWVDDEKSLTTSLSYQYVPSSEVVISPDMSVPDRPTHNHLYTVGAEYVPIEHLAVEVELPLTMVKYTGTEPHLPAGNWDDGNYHTALTDLRVGARYQLLDEPYVAVSPHIALSVPVMDYEVIGFATGGRHLKQAHVGVSLARTLDPYVPNLFVAGGYELTLSEAYDATPRTAAIAQNRSDFETQIGYVLLDGRVSVEIGGDWRIHHGGLHFERFGGYPLELTQHHDPILKEEYIFLGGGAAYAINDNVSVSAAVRFFVRGYNTRDQNLFGTSVSWRL